MGWYIFNNLVFNVDSLYRAHNKTTKNTPFDKDEYDYQMSHPQSQYKITEDKKDLVSNHIERQ